jgi:FKBP-type peptidyl-prolyl cis-trans isomerase FkpA
MTRTASGLYFEEVTVGTGDGAATGDELRVLYSGWLPNGTLFGSGEDADDPLIVTLGVTNLIAGFEEGLRGMRAGGVRKLVIPPALGYGGQANGPIPANSTLVFRVQVISIE